MIRHHADVFPASLQQGGNAFSNIIQQGIQVFRQLPAPVMAFMVNVTEFAPGIALRITIISTFQQRPAIISQQLFEVITAFQ